MPVTKIKLHETMTYREHAITSKSFSRKLGIDLPLQCTRWPPVKVSVPNSRP